MSDEGGTIAERVDMHIFEPSGALLVVNGKDGRPLVTIERDRSLAFGERYEPDEAARIFWEAMARHAPVLP